MTDKCAICGGPLNDHWLSIAGPQFGPEWHIHELCIGSSANRTGATSSIPLPHERKIMAKVDHR